LQALKNPGEIDSSRIMNLNQIKRYGATAPCVQGELSVWPDQLVL